MILRNQDLQGSNELEGMSFCREYVATDFTAALGQIPRGQEGPQGHWSTWQVDLRQAGAKASCSGDLSCHYLRSVVTVCIRAWGVGDHALTVRSPSAVIANNRKVPGGSGSFTPAGGFLPHHMSH